MAIPLPGKALPRHDVTKGGGQPDADDDQPSVTAELRALWGMAAPITALNCVVYLRAMVSVLCLGRLGPLDLAGGALAIGLTNITGHSVLFGLASGLEPLCAQAFGSRNHELLTLSVQRAVLLLLLAAVPIALLWLNVGPILVALGQDPTISAHAASYAAFALPAAASGSAASGTACCPRRRRASRSSSPPSCGAPTGASRPCAPRSWPGWSSPLPPPLMTTTTTTTTRRSASWWWRPPASRRRRRACSTSVVVVVGKLATVHVVRSWMMTATRRCVRACVRVCVQGSPSSRRRSHVCPPRPS